MSPYRREAVDERRWWQVQSGSGGDAGRRRSRRERRSDCAGGDAGIGDDGSDDAEPRQNRAGVRNHASTETGPALARGRGR